MRSLALGVGLLEDAGIVIGAGEPYCRCVFRTGRAPLADVVPAAVGNAPITNR